jgi:hypothetical protein
MTMYISNAKRKKVVHKDTKADKPSSKTLTKSL